MKNKFLLILLNILSFVTAWAADGKWKVNPYDYRYDMTLYAVVQVGEDVMNPQDIELAAFVGNECRGVAEALKLPDDTYVYYMRIRSNKLSGETYKFKVYIEEDDREIEVSTEGGFTFAAESMFGTPSNPCSFAGKLYTLGDVDGDGEITPTDVTLEILFYLEQNPTVFIFEAGDIDGDGEISPTDVTRLILMYLNE